MVSSVAIENYTNGPYVNQKKYDLIFQRHLVENMKLFHDSIHRIQYEYLTIII